MKAENFLAVMLVMILFLLIASEPPEQNKPKKNIIHKLIEEIATPAPEEKDSPIVNLIGECPPESSDYECPIENQLTDSVVIYNFGVDDKPDEEVEE